MDWSVRDHTIGRGAEGVELGGKRVFLQYSPYGCFRGLFLLEELVGAFHGLVEFEAELAVFLPVDDDGSTVSARSEGEAIVSQECCTCMIYSELCHLHRRCHVL